jgi:uncharacterized membrane protein
MTLLRYLMFLSLIVWIGGIIFFAFVLAPTAFTVLPSAHLAGSIVGPTLSKLHWMGIVSGIVFLLSSFALAWFLKGRIRPFAARNVLFYIMLALTLVSQFGVMPKMAALRASVGDIETVAPNNPARVEFDALHQWSVRLEGGVLLLGLVAAYLTSRHET